MLSILRSILPAQSVAQRALQRPAAARRAVERSDEYSCTSGAYRIS